MIKNEFLSCDKVGGSEFFYYITGKDKLQKENIQKLNNLQHHLTEQLAKHRK